MTRCGTLATRDQGNSSDRFSRDASQAGLWFQEFRRAPRCHGESRACDECPKIANGYAEILVRRKIQSALKNLDAGLALSTTIVARRSQWWETRTRADACQLIETFVSVDSGRVLNAWTYHVVDKAVAIRITQDLTPVPAPLHTPFKR